MATSEVNWSDNINNRLTENHSSCIAVPGRSETCLGRPVLLWLTGSHEPQVASVSEAIMTDRGRLVALCDLYQRGIITDIELLRRIQPNMLGSLEGYGADPSTHLATVRGLPASPGQALGRVAFRAFSREHKSGLPPILFIPEFVPEDIIDLEESGCRRDITWWHDISCCGCEPRHGVAMRGGVRAPDHRHLEACCARRRWSTNSREHASCHRRDAGAGRVQ